MPVAVIFSSVRSPGDNEAYNVMAARMAALVSEQPGFLRQESARGADRFGITVSYWASLAAASAWKRVVEHKVAQELGKSSWYTSYHVTVATIEREYGSTPADPCPAAATFAGT